jgi:hypothetical protein
MARAGERFFLTDYVHRPACCACVRAGGNRAVASGCAERSSFVWSTVDVRNTTEISTL